MTDALADSLDDLIGLGDAETAHAIRAWLAGRRREERPLLRCLRRIALRSEVARATLPPARYAVDSPAALVDYLAPEMADLAHEQLRVVLLDPCNGVLGVRLLCQGAGNVLHVRNADCLRAAIVHGAAAVVFVHNHPSGSPEPSPEDVAWTAEIGWLAEAHSIEVVDHLVLGRDADGGTTFVSLRQRGLYAPGPRPDDGAAVA